MRNDQPYQPETLDGLNRQQTVNARLQSMLAELREPSDHKINRESNLDIIKELFDFDANSDDENTARQSPINITENRYGNEFNPSVQKQNRPLSEDIYKEVTRSITASIRNIIEGDEEFQLPWHKLELPKNIKSGRYKSGINIILLWYYANKQRFISNTWGTQKQWEDKGYKIKEEEEGRTFSVVGFKKIPNKEIFLAPTKDDSPQIHENKKEDSHNGEFLIIPTHLNQMYNADQIEEFSSEEPAQFSDLSHVKSFVDGTCAVISHWGNQAYYSMEDDTIIMPDPKRFKVTDTSNPTENYYAVLFHELIHWTGSESRLNRNILNKFGDEDYAFEELTAELGAAFLCSKLNVSITPRQEHAKYLEYWLRRLENDERAIFTAANEAQRACEFLHNLNKNKTK